MVGPDWNLVRLFVRPGVTDMRKQIGGLAMIVEGQMEHSPFEDSLFVFCNRQRKIMKILYWDRNGFCLWQKRLEKHQFPWPQSEDAAREITAEQLRMVLEGIDFWNAHTRLNYTQVG